ncbi:MAG: AI-2E family transporter, partial [Burkholderiaceae bacterium]
MAFTPSDDNHPVLRDKTFVLLLVLVTLAFGWILWPYYGAVLWGTAMAIVFAPAYGWLLRRTGQRRTLAALATVLMILLLVILPLGLVMNSLLTEGTALFARIKSGELGLNGYLQQIYNALPDWLSQLLGRFGMTSLAELQGKLMAALNQGGQMLAGKALGVGQDTFDFIVSLGVMLYLLFFLLRDGDQLKRRIRDAVPLNPQHKHELGEKFITVIRATVKGNIAVA